jgi:glutathione S-transferase
MKDDDLYLYELAGADFDLRFSPHCWKIRMALAHKRVPAVLIPCRFSEKDKISFSGQGFLPVLKDGEKAINGSYEIARYLEERFADRPSLFESGGEPLARFVNTWADHTLHPSIAKIILLDVFECLGETDGAYFRATREKRFGMPLERVVEDRPGSLDIFRKTVVPLEHLLAQQPFVCGETPGYADYCVFGMFMWARCTSRAQLLESETNIIRWRESLLDAFDGAARSAPIRS